MTPFASHVPGPSIPPVSATTPSSVSSLPSQASFIPPPQHPYTRAYGLPQPTYHPPDRTKKSHARKQPEGHVPRPRNPFILFRCDFVRQKMVPPGVEKDHRNISRIVGAIWREMTGEQQRPWVEMADMEKAKHKAVHPGYRYAPGTVVAEGEGAGGPGIVARGGGSAPGVVRKRKKRGDVNDEEIARIAYGRDRGPTLDSSDFHDRSSSTNAKNTFRGQVPDDVSFLTPLSMYETPLINRRSSSCPPGTPRVTPFSPTVADVGPPAILMTRDDLARRPSRVTMYTSSSSSTMPDPNLAHLSAASVALYDHNAAPRHPDHWKDVRPVLEGGAYLVDPPGDAPSWGGVGARDWDWDGTKEGGVRVVDDFVSFSSVFSLVLADTL